MKTKTLEKMTKKEILQHVELVRERLATLEQFVDEVALRRAGPSTSVAGLARRKIADRNWCDSLNRRARNLRERRPKGGLYG